MSLQFIMGPSGSGKSHYLYQYMIEESEKHPEKQYILLVPEQYTMQATRDYIAASPKKGILNVDILSFGRLAYRVFEETGKNNKIVLDDVGKSLVLKKVAKKCEGELCVLGRNLQRIGYIEEVKSAISEFTQYEIKEEQLEELLSEMDGSSNFYYKMRDIATIYKEFRSYLEQKYITGEELLDVLCEALPDSTILRDSVIVLDGFTGFTPIQNRLIRELLLVCEKVMVSVTISGKENPYSYCHPYQLYALSKQTVTSLIRIAEEEKREIEEPVCFFEEPPYRVRKVSALQFLNANLFGYGDKKYEEQQEHIKVCVAKNPKEEIDFVAQKIRKLVRKEGYRYRDVAIVTPDLEVYGRQIESTFALYGLPVFMDLKRSILLNSFVEYIRSFLQMVEQNFSYESVFRYLRTGMTELRREEIDVLENYVIAAGVRGYSRWKETWTKTTGSVDEKELVRLNEWREQFVQRREDAFAVLKSRNKTVYDVTNALHTFLMKEGLQKKVKEQEEAFLETGELVLSKEYAQIYRIVIDLFDKFVELLGEERISLKEYCELLDAGLSQAKVGTIPPSLDQVVVGDMERTRIQEVKAVFLVGMNDVYIPGDLGNRGLISDADREQFEKHGLHLAPCAKEKIYTQKFYLYLLMAKPSEYLYLTYSKNTMDGKVLRPSYVIANIRQMFTKLSVQEISDSLEKREMTERTGISYLVRGIQKGSEGFDDAWKELYSWYKGQAKWQEKVEQILEAAFCRKPEESLTAEMARQLYGTLLKNSVTRLEKFASCAYAHFLTYGLGLAQREEFEFRTVDFGNIFHSALEHFSIKVQESEYEWINIPEEKQEEWLEASVQETVSEYENAAISDTARNSYVISRVKRMMRRTVWALIKQLQKGDFTPFGYEVTFDDYGELQTTRVMLEDGNEMVLRGKIDRIDICEDENHVYVKIIDYKTGSKSFDISDLYYGLQMQLVTYLAVAVEMQQKKHPDKEVLGAGVLYYQIKDPIVQEADDDVLELQILKELRPDGLVNGNEEVIHYFDSSLEGESLVAPLKRVKSGEMSKTSKTIDAVNFKRMTDFAMKKIREIGTRMMSGDVEIAPYVQGNTSSCAYCPYKGVCKFDEKIPGYEYRVLEKLTKEEVMERWREEV